MLYQDWLADIMMNLPKRFSAPTVLIAFALLFPTQISWAGDKDKDKEPGLDPYTKMNPAAMKAAGYDKFGPFEITNTHTTQDVEDFIRSDYGKAIVTNSSIQMLMKQSTSAADKLKDIFYLSQGEKHLLLSAEVGEGIFVAS